MKKSVLLFIVLALAACSKKQEVACNGEAATSVMTSILKDALVKQVTSAIAADGNANVNVDGASIRATVEKISIKLEDVLTTKSDPNSTKKFCESTLKLSLPTDVIANADATRSMLSLNNLHQGALQSGVDFDADTVKANMPYSVQPTDDGKKVYGSTEGDNSALTFTSTIVEQSLLRSALERQKAAQVQEQQQAALQAQQQQVAVAQAQAAEAQATLDKAQADMKSANDAINVVWNAGSKEWRQNLLPEQRLWLAQRENDCKIKALDSAGSDSIAFQTSKLTCEVQMTVDRTQVLKTALQQNMAQVNSQTSQ